MATDHRAELASIKTFPQLINYLGDRMNWPIEQIEIDELTFDYTPEELGIDPKNAAKIVEIKRLRPLSVKQPWGIFFIKFAPTKLPVVALRRILGQVVLKKRATARAAELKAWSANDLLFISNYGEGEARHITFAHFSQPEGKKDLPTLKVLGWDNLDTPLHLDAVAKELTEHLAWPDDDENIPAWRDQWRSAFTVGHHEVITTSKQLSIALAKLARNIRDRIKAALAIETERGPLTRLMNAFRESLLHDLKPDDFADMYAQTIAYGLLSARITDPESKTADDFAIHMRTNPFLKELMETFLHVGGRRGKNGHAGIDFDELGVNDVVELLDAAKMDRVVADFGDKNPQEDPVIHFYESFLKEYDAKKRMQLGVFYTPRPVVSYIVRSVDELLRTEFGLPDGLADVTTWGEMAKRDKDLKIPHGSSPDKPFVQILDPACGTGTFLVEVIDVIHRTLLAKWRKTGHAEQQIALLWNDYVPEFLLPRLHGYELLMAPYAIAHLKIGLKLHETGYHFDSEERARVFLTNALEPPGDIQFRLSAMPALAHEAQAVNEVKRKQRFSVMIGNPPYSALSANLTDSARALVTRFKYIDGVRLNERGALQLEKNLQDDYIKFLAFAEDNLAETPAGVCGLICNHGFIDNPTLRGVRWSLLSNLHRIWILDLHGNVNRGEKAPDGSEDDNVFDIKDAGVAIFLGTKKSANGGSGSQLFKGDLFGKRESVKYPFLVSQSVGSSSWVTVRSNPDMFLFRVLGNMGASEYFSWLKVTDIFPLHSIGMITARDSYVIDFETAPLLERARAFRDSQLDDEATCESLGIPIKKGWSIRRSRERIKNLQKLESCIQPLLYRPFDTRHVFYHESLIWGMAWPVMKHMVSGRNLALVTSRMTKGEAFHHALVSNTLSEVILLSSKTSNNAFVFPLYRYPGEGELQTASQVNLSAQFLHALGLRLGLGLGPLRTAPSGLAEGVGPEEIFNFTYAVLNSLGYRTRYSEFLAIDFPRIPLPNSIDTFRDLARLGGKLVSCHLLESMTSAHFAAVYSGPKRPTVERVGWSNDTVWVDAAPTKKGQPATSGTIGFRGVPAEIWNFHIGGYQVCQKWLKDRKGRTLSDDDILHYQKVIVAISETIRLMKEIDEVIEAHGGWPGAFQTGTQPAAAETSTPPFRIIADPREEERYVTCVPLVPLKVAASAFSESQHVVDDEWEWAEVKATHRLRPGMFVAQVVGRSMEPRIRDGAWCLFAGPVTGSRQGKTVLAKLHSDTDPESGANYTLKRYESEKVRSEDGWAHARIILKPENPEFAPLVFEQSPDESLAVIAELVEVLSEATPEPEDDPTPEPEPDPAPRASRAKSNPLQQQLISPPRRVAVAPTHGIFSAQPPHPSRTDDDSDAKPVRIVDEYEVEDVLLHIRGIINSADPIPRDEAIRQITHALGGERVGSSVRDLIDSALTTASRRLIVETVSGGLIPATRTIDDYHRDFLKTTLKAVIGNTWTGEDDAIRAATHHLGFNRTGPNIRDAFKSAINGLIRKKELEREGRMLRRRSGQ